MGAVVVIAVVFAALATFAVLAVLFGADSRDGMVDARRPFVPAGID
jgi:hypothetical protein